MRISGVSFLGIMIPTSAALEELAVRLGAGRVRRNVVLAPYTTFNIGGPADLFYEATTADDLAAVVGAARALEIPYFLLGLGANILVGDRGFRGLVIRNTANRWAVSDKGLLQAESGTLVSAIIPAIVRQGWSGLEHYVGIPSTIGGAIWQNLHFLSPPPERTRTVFIAEIFHSAELLRGDNSRVVVNAGDMEFGYDTSRLHHSGEVVLSAEFQCSAGNPEEMQRIMQENLAWRGARHPWLDWYPSAGSIFQKIEGLGAGRLIDKVGLKGHRCGGAQISHLHANIIVNLGAATATDVRQLISVAQDSVESEFGVRLTPEIEFVGEFEEP